MDNQGHNRRTSVRPQPRAEVSDELRAHPLVTGLVECLGERLVFTTGGVSLGQISADSMGKIPSFSLWTPNLNGREFIILNLLEENKRMNFPTMLYLKSALPQRNHAVDEYVTFLYELGLNIDNRKDNWQTAGHLHARAVLPHLDDLAKCVLALVDTQ